ncbi:protein FAR1-RELATED SEQUENCE 5-like [Sesbania bispinosa]|nr:protein FAR1-RELATED SEQUENCE 5-like [Sesbania bispinosa]
MDDNIEGVSYHEGCLDDNEDVTYVQSLLQGMGFDSEKDFVNVDPSLLTAELVMTFHFSNLEMAYKFYNWYGRILGFSARKGVHNHDLLDKIHSSMLPAHRKMTDADIMQINNLRMVGISTPHIYGTFATQSGGFQHVGFSKRDIYNEIGRQRVMQVSDVKGAFQYLRDRGSAEGPIFWSHTLDSEVFKKCMLGDYEIYEFQHRWVKVVTECGLEENTWVKDLYERRSMWATCYIRGTFFTGIRTTSRCEGLHAQLGRFVHSRHGLVDFLQNFHHCLEYFRYKEIEADYASLVGQPVLQTNLHALERSASRLFKREIFKLFRPALAKGVMVHLNMDEIPGCLVLDRWTMAVKENLYQLCDKRTSMWDSIFMARCGCLDALSRKVNRLASRSTFKFNSIRDLLTEQLKRMEITDESNNGGDGENCNEVSHGCVRDPNKVGSKGCAGPSSMSGPQRKRRQRCGICGGVGHNRKTCPMNNSVDHVMMSQQGSNLHHDDADNNFNEPFGLDEYDAYGF